MVEPIESKTSTRRDDFASARPRPLLLPSRADRLAIKRDADAGQACRGQPLSKGTPRSTRRLGKALFACTLS